ncbi:MAG: T9SS type A sorting domain-containing protein [Bacteroidales bacterium]|nr:T9SS type A sorting domain-containing protein [Bacteroidales bacterium]
MKKTFLLAALLLLSSLVMAQTAVTATGGTAAGVVGSFSYSVGQPATLNTSNDSKSAHEGVMQPATYRVESISEAQDIAVSIFPNPTSDGVTLQRDYTDKPLTVELYSADGRRLETSDWETATMRLDMSRYAAGSYILKVNTDNRISTYKITKR